MKFFAVLPFAALCAAFVLPPEQVLSELEIEDHHESSTDWYEEAISIKDGAYDETSSAAKEVYEQAASTKDNLLSSFEQYFQRAKDTTDEVWNDISESSKSLMDEAFSRADSASDAIHETANDMQSWFEDNVAEAFDDGHHGPPHGGKPRHPPHGKKPHHPPHHKPNQTVYELIAGSNYTTTLAKLISEYPDLVEALNSTSANYTIFAPTNKAFEKIPDKAPKPSKEQLKAILSYHVLPDVYPAGRVLLSHTAPTLLKGDHLSSKPEPQRIVFKLGLRGLTVNYYSRIIAVNIFGTNGVIHGVDSILLPPPSTITLIDLFPTEFSTLELGLGKTGLLEKLNTTDHAGGTFFAPSNWAFQKLGPRINAFLFSKYGEKYLKALLEYHVVPGHTLYSDAYYHADSEEKGMDAKGYFHVQLPTLLEKRELAVDIARYGGFISIKINGFSTVSIQDAVAEDGVLHVVSSVLIPPKHVGGVEKEMYGGEEITVEELKERLEPFVVREDL